MLQMHMDKISNELDKPNEVALNPNLQKKYQDRHQPFDVVSSDNSNESRPIDSKQINVPNLDVRSFEN